MLANIPPQIVTKKKFENNLLNTILLLIFLYRLLSPSVISINVNKRLMPISR